MEHVPSEGDNDPIERSQNLIGSARYSGGYLDLLFWKLSCVQCLNNIVGVMGIFCWEFYTTKGL